MSVSKGGDHYDRREKSETLFGEGNTRSFGPNCSLVAFGTSAHLGAEPGADKRRGASQLGRSHASDRLPGSAAFQALSLAPASVTAAQMAPSSRWSTVVTVWQGDALPFSCLAIQPTRESINKPQVILSPGVFPRRYPMIPTRRISIGKQLALA